MIAQRPSVGRVVHFHDEGGPYAATITFVDPETGLVDLVTFGRRSVYFHHKVAFGGDRDPAKGSWTWPPRN